MGLRIATNIPALSAQRSLLGNLQSQQRSLEKLSSGSRINRSGDDAAGLAISEKLRANIRSMSQAIRNANDGISLIQVAEGSLNEVGNVLVRIRELSIQGASDTIGDKERQFIDKEVQQLKAEVHRIGETTEFNGRKLLNGSSPVLEVQVGLHNNPLLDRIRFDSQAQTTTLESLGIEELGGFTKEASQMNLEVVDKAMDKLLKNRADLGALQNRLQSTINNMVIYKENLAAANSRIRDTDIAKQTSELTRTNILTQSNIAMLGQANATPKQALSLLG